MSSLPSEAEDGVPSSSQRSRSALDWGGREVAQNPGRVTVGIHVKVRVMNGIIVGVEVDQGQAGRS